LTLWRWIRWQGQASPEETLFLPQEKFLGEMEKLKSKPKLFQLFDRALVLASRSPLSVLRIQRLYFLLQAKGGLLESKLREMADANFQITESHFQLPATSLFGTQFDAYLENQLPKFIWERYCRRIQVLADTFRIADRVERRREILKPLTRERGEVFSALG